MVSRDKIRSAGEVNVLAEDGVRRNTSNPTARLSRQSSTARPPPRETGLNRRMFFTGISGGTSTAASEEPINPSQLAKRRLPWLSEGKRPIPHTPTERGKGGRHYEQLPRTEAALNHQNSKGLSPPKTPSTHQKTPLLRDPSIRPIGSVPSLKGGKSEPAAPRKASSVRSILAGTSSMLPRTSLHLYVPPKAPRSVEQMSGYTPSNYSAVTPSESSFDTDSTVIPDGGSYKKPVQLPIAESKDSLSAAEFSAASDKDQVPQMVTSSPVIVLDAKDLKPDQTPLSEHSERSTDDPFADDKYARGLQEAMTGLDDLMEEAMRLANDVVVNNQSEEFSNILGVTTQALRQAQSTSENYQPASVGPFGLSISADVSDGDTSQSDDSSGSDTSVASDEAQPTLMTELSMPMIGNVINQHQIDGETPTPSRAALVGKESNGHAVPQLFDREVSYSGTATPPQFYQKPSVESVAIDWAYEKHRQVTPGSSRSSFASGKDRVLRKRTANLRTPQTSTHRLLEPAPAQPPRRDYADHLLREGGDMRIPQHNRPEVFGVSGLHNRAPSAKFDSASSDSARHVKPRRRRSTHSTLSIGDAKLSGSETEKAPPWSYNIDRSVRHRLDRGLDNDLEKGSRNRKHKFRKRAGDFRHQHRHQPISRKWHNHRKRIVAMVACTNTAIVGLLIGVYAGEVPKIQYLLADTGHIIIMGNVLFYVGMAVSTFFTWPLPLLHGRKPYTLMALGLALPLEFPQGILVGAYREPVTGFRVGLLLARLFSGLVLGFAQVNFLATLLDLFGASLQSSNPHQELVVIDDVRRQGGGMGIWLGIWSWCFISSLSIGFCIGACIIERLSPAWGFYIVIILLAFLLVLNVLCPETRRSPSRHCVAEYVDENDKLRRRTARGEISLHISTKGPTWWGDELGAGALLSVSMFIQRGFFILAMYLGWIYAQVVLVIVLLGALMSRGYHMRATSVGLSVFSIAIGALFAVPLAKAGLFSRERTHRARTDSMTFQKQVTWTSHMVRRIIFTTALPIAGLAYTLASPGIGVHWMVPIFFAGLIGFLSNLAIAECLGIIMETYDTSDLQPGVNSRHRLQSMAEETRRRRTNYSSFPRVTAGIYVAQTTAFLLSAAATGVGGALTRNLGAQTATGITAGILFSLTLALTAVLWRYKQVQVIPNNAFGTMKVGDFQGTDKEFDEYWKPVVLGNPSGKYRKMNELELGKLSRWTEIRRLNRLYRD